VRLREQGVRVEVIRSERGVVELDQFVSQLRPSTRLVSVSQVSYKTGTQFPYLKELAAEVHRAGALFVLDATQALGRVPVSVEGVDYLVSSSYKWLLGIHGLGLIYCAPALLEELKPGAAGWYSVVDSFAEDRFERLTLRDGAARFVGGMPNFASLYVMREALRFLYQLGVSQIDKNLRPLVRCLREGVAALGLPMLTPADDRFASGIVSFEHRSPEELGRALNEKGIILWAGDGRLRASVHIYNSEDDIDRLLIALKELNGTARPI
jgi:cysteine desulfurase/selenocysteine lyase